MKTPADILAEHSPVWRSLLSGRPRVGVCYRCARPDVELKECCGAWGLIEWLCDGCRPVAHNTAQHEAI